MSSLPWFMDITFQIPMQYYSLPHWILLSPPDIHYWKLFPLWPNCVILSGTISSSPVLSSSLCLDWSAFKPVDLVDYSAQCGAAVAAAKSLQSCLTLCDPRDGSPPGSPVHGIFQARVLEWGAIAFSGPMWWASSNYLKALNRTKGREMWISSLPYTLSPQPPLSLLELRYFISCPPLVWNLNHPPPHPLPPILKSLDSDWSNHWASWVSSL